MSGQVLFHPSHICQIGESDQGLSAYLELAGKGDYICFNILVSISPSK
jgi:hypothetical protein